MGSLADCMLADAILIPSHPPIPPTATMNVRGLLKSAELTLKTEK